MTEKIIPSKQWLFLILNSKCKNLAHFAWFDAFNQSK